MSKYETVFVCNAALGDEGYAAMNEKFKALIEKNASDVVVEEWGKRRLAYAINHINEGYYTLISFATEDNSFSAELTRVYNITEGIIRSLVINKDKK